MTILLRCRSSGLSCYPHAFNDPIRIYLFRMIIAVGGRYIPYDPIILNRGCISARFRQWGQTLEIRRSEVWLGSVTNGSLAVDQGINPAPIARHTSKMAQKSKHAYLRASVGYSGE